MNQPRGRAVQKVLSLFLILAFILAPMAQALTTDQLKTLLQEYYLGEVSDTVLDQDTIETVIQTLGDPYTRYMNVEDYQAMLSSMTDQKISGIGINANVVEEGLLIVLPHEGSPAQKAGLVAGDIIIAVDGKSATGQPGTIVTQWLRGETGTQVTIEVLHESGAKEQYTLTRTELVIPSTSSQTVLDRVGYIDCTTFGPTTQTHFLEAMEAEKDAAVWMVDLRKNPGGDVNATAQSLGVFLGKGTVVYMRNGQDQYILFMSQQDVKTIKPTIVLTSQYTASAAEIFSGVIRDVEQGLVIGAKTFGKGVAQVILDSSVPGMEEYFKDGDALAITAYRYYTPSGSTADQIGVIPHLLVDPAQADEIALLLTAVEPATNLEQYLRVDIGGWRWTIDLQEATAPENLSNFSALLGALPPGTPVLQGTAKNTWVATSVQSLVEKYQLTDYHYRGFSDVSRGEAGDKINTLATYDILKGKGNGVFNPKGTITRAELCALLVQAMNLKAPKTVTTFSDVPKGAWYADEVAAASGAGLMKGLGDGRFDPKGIVSQEQLITIMARAGINLSAYLYEGSKTWSADTDNVPEGFDDWAQSSVWLLDESQLNPLGGPLSLLHRNVEEISPRAAATREDAAVLLYNLFTHIQILNV
ncbi:MAG: peptidase [Firmicutes bacterium]|nr:peptidase [Bacillota bacterium]